MYVSGSNNCSHCHMPPPSLYLNEAQVWEQSIRVEQTDMFKKSELWSSPEGSENTSYLDFLNILKS